MDPKMESSDRLVLIVITVTGILLSAVFLWTHAGVGDMEPDAGVMSPVGVAWDAPRGPAAR